MLAAAVESHGPDCPLAAAVADERNRLPIGRAGWQAILGRVIAQVSHRPAAERYGIDFPVAVAGRHEENVVAVCGGRSVFFLRIRRHPRSTLFPYTTLFR